MKTLAKLLLLSLLGLTAAGLHANEISTGQSLQIGQSLNSNDGKYSLVQQADGNLVLYRTADGNVMWTSYANGTYAVIQGDGNFVQYNASGVAVWSSGTGGHAYNANYKLGVANNGPIYIQDGNSKAILWSTPIDPSAPPYYPCGGQKPYTSYTFCYNRGTTFQYTTVVQACSLAEAMTKAPGATYGMCPF